MALPCSYGGPAGTGRVRVFCRVKWPGGASFGTGRVWSWRARPSSQPTRRPVGAGQAPTRTEARPPVTKRDQAIYD
jgi:hypothetical protein